MIHTRRNFIRAALAVLLVCAVLTPQVLSAQTGSERQLLRTQETVAGRNADTRLWENVYQVPETSLAVGGTGRTSEQTESYIEKGTNLCYDARPEDSPALAPYWQISDPTIEIIEEPTAEGYA